jgi:hypothetical protein
MNRKLKIILWLVVATILIAARQIAREHHYLGWALFLELINVIWAGLFWFNFWRHEEMAPEDRSR